MMNQHFRFAIILAFILSFLFSCEKEPENVFLGTWELSEFRLDCPSEGLANLSITAADGCMLFQGEALCITISFESDTEGMLTIGEGGGENEARPFTYSVNDSQSSVRLCIEGEDCEEIELSDGRLILRESDPECPAEYFLDKQ